MAESLLQGLQAAANATSQVGVSKIATEMKFYMYNYSKNIVCFEFNYFGNKTSFKAVLAFLHIKLMYSL